LLRDILLKAEESLHLDMPTKDKKTSTEGVDVGLLYKNYIKECAAIGIEQFGPVKAALTNEANPNRGKQIIVVTPGNGDCLGSGGVRALVNAIIAQPFTAVKDIRISSQLKDPGAAAIGTLLSATAKKLLVNNIASDDGSAPPPPEWQLEYLELVNNGIGRDGALAIGRSLCVGMNKTLAALVLDFNPLGSNGMNALCKGLRTNSTLKRLSVRHCSIDEHGGKAVGEMLHFKKTALIALDLSSNKLGCIGLRDMLSEGMDENTSLKTLRLAENSIGQTDDDFKTLESFAIFLMKHPSLVAVDLMHNRIGTTGGTLLLPAVTENKRLTEFKVDSNMDNDVFKALFRVSAPPKKKVKSKD